MLRVSWRTAGSTCRRRPHSGRPTRITRPSPSRESVSAGRVTGSASPASSAAAMASSSTAASADLDALGRLGLLDELEAGERVDAGQQARCRPRRRRAAARPRPRRAGARDAAARRTGRRATGGRGRSSRVRATSTPRRSVSAPNDATVPPCSAYARRRCASERGTQRSGPGSRTPLRSAVRPERDAASARSVVTS